MSILLRNFRQWWQPPRGIADRPEHRQVTFLELFYDLVYVVLIAEMTHSLASQIDTQHLANFTFLFVIVWWSWLNGTLYHEIHGNNDIRTRVFTFMQMFCVAGMSVFAHDAMGETSIGFAISFGTFQLILTYLWWRTGVYDKNHAPLSRPYTVMFLITTALFFASVFVPLPTRVHMWFVAVVIAFIFPMFTFTLGRDDPAVQLQIEMSRKASDSLVERFGLFTIIVLGEVIVGTVQGVAAHHKLTLEVILIGAIGMLIAIGLWWLYFDFVSHRHPQDESNGLLIWMYLHLPVTIGIATTGATVLNVIEHTGEKLPVDVRWLLVIAIGVALIGIVLLIQTLRDDSQHHQAYRTGQLVMLASASVIIALGFSTLQIIPLLVLIVALLLAPTFFGLVFWVREMEATES